MTSEFNASGARRDFTRETPDVEAPLTLNWLTLVGSPDTARSARPSIQIAGDSGIVPRLCLEAVKEPEPLRMALAQHQDFRDVLLAWISVVNKQIEQHNKTKLNKRTETALDATSTTAIDATKIKDEWARNEFGPESRKLWSRMDKLLSEQTLLTASFLGHANVPLPAGSFIRTRTSQSGSGLPETDEMFKSRLHENQVQCKLNLSKLEPGQSPPRQDMQTVIEATTWLLAADKAAAAGAIVTDAAHQGTRIDLLKSVVPTHNFKGWKQPDNLPPDQVRLWAAKAKLAADTVEQLQMCVEDIHAFTAATKKSGPPGLTDLIHKSPELRNAMKFDGAKALANFPGKVTRTGGTLTIELDLPRTLEGTTKDWEQAQAWLQLWEPQLRQIRQAIIRAKTDNQILSWLDNSNFPTFKQVTAAALLSHNPQLKGQPGEPVKLANEKDWVIHSVAEDGSYRLQKKTPPDDRGNRHEFNYERYRIKVQPMASPDHLLVKGYKEYLKASSHSYHGYWGLKATDGKQHDTMKERIVHKDDYVVVEDNGRLRLIQAKFLQRWADAQENARVTGRAISTGLDLGMLCGATVGFRAAFSIAAKQGAGTLRCLGEGVRNSWFEAGIAATSFGRQSIENAFPEGGGHFAMQLRDMVLTADMGARILNGKGLGFVRHPKAAEIAETFKASKTWYDATLRSVNKPFVGAMRLADYYFIASFSDALARTSGDGHRKPLYSLANTQPIPGDRTYRYTGDVTSALQMRTLITPITNYYCETLQSKLPAEAADCALLPADDPRIAAIGKRAANMFNNSKASERDRTAAAIALMCLQKTSEADESLAGTNVTARSIFSYLRERANKSADPQLRIAAGDALFRAAREATATLYAETAILKELRSESKPASPEKQADDLVRNWSSFSKKQDNGDALKAFRVRCAENEIARNESLLKAINYDAPQFTRTLMECARNPNNPRSVRADAIASPSGPRLAYMLNHLSIAIEPSYLASGNDRLIASLYGCDSHAVEKLLQEIASGKDSDLRMLACQALLAARQDRLTVNGVPITPHKVTAIGSESDVRIGGTDAKHALITQDHQGKVSLQAANAGSQVWLIRPGEPPKQVQERWTTVSWGDRVILGAVATGTELIFGNEAQNTIARLGAQLKVDFPKPGSIASAYAAELRNTLTLPVPPVESFAQYQAHMARHYAALSVFELAARKGSEVDDLKVQAATALKEGILSGIPTLAKASLVALTRERFELLPVQDQSDLRERYLRALLSSRPQTRADQELLELSCAKIPEIFANASPQEKTKAALSLECLLIKPAERLLSTTHPRASFPPYSASKPELRQVAMIALAKLDPGRATDIGGILLMGGNYRGVVVQRDTALVRAAAVQALQLSKPPNWHEIALRALPGETDPAVLRSLWKLEYVARPELDGFRAKREFEAMSERLTTRASQGLFADAQTKCRETTHSFGSWSLFEELKRQSWGNSTITPARFIDAQARRARAGLVYVAMNDEKLSAAASREIYYIVSSERSADALKSLSAELGPALERALLSSRANQALFDAYCKLKPWEHGHISREEVAVLCGRILQNQAKTRHLHDHGLETQVLKLLKHFPSEKVIPILAALAHGEPVKEVDERNRPIKIVYANGLTRTLAYKNDVLDSFTETRDGKSTIFKRLAGEGDVFMGSNNERRQGVHVNCQPAPSFPMEWHPDAPPDLFKDMVNGKHFVVRGAYSDFVWERDGQRFVEKGNGTVIEEHRESANRRVVTFHYGDGTKREFAIVRTVQRAQARDQQDKHDFEIHVNGPGGQIEKWHYLYGRSFFTNADPRISSIERYANTACNKVYVPFCFDTGTYMYMVPLSPGAADLARPAGHPLSVRRTFTSDGAVYESTRGTSTQTKAGHTPEAHPSPEVRGRARDLANTLQNSLALPQMYAQEELRFARRNTSQPSFAMFAPGADAKMLADWMASRLSDAKIDAHTLSRSLIMGSMAKPLEGSADPRLFVLLAALNDKSDLVRLTAATMLAKSPVVEIRQQAVNAMVQVARYGETRMVRSEATALLRNCDSQSVATAWKDLEARPNQFVEPSRIFRTVDVRQQVVFETLRRSLSSGAVDPMAFDFIGYCQEKGFSHLGRLAFSRAVERETDPIRQKPLPTLFASESKMRRDRKITDITNRHEVTMWRQFDQIRHRATDTVLPEKERASARQALLYVVATDGRDFGPGHRAIAVSKSLNTLLSVFESGADRSRLEQPLRTMLTNDMGLLPSVKERLTKSLGSLVNDKLLSSEVAVEIAMTALELETRFMPRPDQPMFKQSISYQTKLLDLIADHATSDQLPALDSLSRNMAVKEVHDKARLTREVIHARKSAGLKQEFERALSGAEYPIIMKPDDLRVRWLADSVSEGKRPINQRIRAVEITIDERNVGIGEKQRKQAADYYTGWMNDPGLSLESRFGMASKVLVNPLFNQARRDQAALVVGRAALSTAPTLQTMAQQALWQLQPSEAQASTSALLRASRDAWLGGQPAQTDRAFALVEALRIRLLAAGKDSNIQRSQIAILSSLSLEGCQPAFKLLQSVAGEQHQLCVAELTRAFENFQREVSEKNASKEKARQQWATTLRKNRVDEKTIAENLDRLFKPLQLDPRIEQRYRRQATTLKALPQVTGQ